MANVFVSYRRDDSADVSGRINDRLVEHFGESSIYKDVDTVPLGINFSEHIGQAVAECDVLLAVIGPRWLTVISEDGERRLDDPQDYVRIEIEAALARQIPVIPLLVRGATIPAKSSLPESLQELPLRNGTPIRPDPDFHRDLDRLINSLEKHLDRSEPSAVHLGTNVEKPNSGDTVSQNEPGSLKSNFLPEKFRPSLTIVVAVASAFVFGILATMLVTGSFSDSDSTAESTGSGKTVETAGEKTQNADPQPLDQKVDQQETSTDRDRPVWLTGNEIRGKGLGKTVSHYYAFYGGPDDVKFTVDGLSKTSSPCYFSNSAVHIYLYKFNDAKTILKNRVDGRGLEEREIWRVDVNPRQSLILRVITSKCTIRYMIRLEGAVEFAGN